MHTEFFYIIGAIWYTLFHSVLTTTYNYKVSIVEEPATGTLHSTICALLKRKRFIFSPLYRSQTWPFGLCGQWYASVKDVWCYWAQACNAQFVCPHYIECRSIHWLGEFICLDSWIMLQICDGTCSTNKKCHRFKPEKCSIFLLRLPQHNLYIPIGRS